MEHPGAIDIEPDVKIIACEQIHVNGVQRKTRCASCRVLVRFETGPCGLKVAWPSRPCARPGTGQTPVPRQRNPIGQFQTAPTPPAE